MSTVDRLEILTEHYKSYFPEDIEAIVMTKEDYERQFGNTFETTKKETVINDLLKRISNLEFEVERLTCDNESLSSNNSKLAKRLLEAIEYIEKTPLVKGTEYYRIQLLDILKGVDKE